MIYGWIFRGILSEKLRGLLQHAVQFGQLTTSVFLVTLSLPFFGQCPPRRDSPRRLALFTTMAPKFKNGDVVISVSKFAL